MKSKRILLLIILSVCIGQTAFAQLAWVQIGVNGLTCSQCTRAVEMSILKLDFVKDVQMNLDKTEGKITFKEGGAPDLRKIAKAVVNAGFSMRYLKAGLNADNLAVSDGYKWNSPVGELCFTNTGSKSLNGLTTLNFVNKQFLERSEFSKWKKAIKTCCGDAEKEMYYVTLE